MKHLLMKDSQEIIHNMDQCLLQWDLFLYLTILHMVLISFHFLLLDILQWDHLLIPIHIWTILHMDIHIWVLLLMNILIWEIIIMIMTIKEDMKLMIIIIQMNLIIEWKENISNLNILIIIMLLSELDLIKRRQISQ